MTSSTSCLSTCFENYLQKDVTSANLKRKRKESVESDFQDLDEEDCRMLEYVPKIGEVFRIVEKIGEGTFSSVYLAKLKTRPEINQFFALKHIIPTSHPSRIENELKYLKLIGGADNVIGVSCCIREKDHVVIVMPYFSHDKFQNYLQLLSVEEICDYMKHLMIALKRVHQFDIIHRDVKPSNFLYNRKSKSYALVDFGLAHKAPVLLKGKEGENNGKTPLSPSKRKTRRSVENVAPASLPKSQSSSSAHEVKERNSNIDSAVKLEMPEEQGNNDTKPVHKEKPGSVFPRKQFKSPRGASLHKRTILANAGLTLTRGDTIINRRSMSRPLGFKGQVPATCNCFGTASVCSVCVSRSNQTAPRAGTPGYRSPEVLMKCPNQSTAVDMWSAGVIFLSLLTRRYPFFRANDDLTALAQIISVIGSQEIQKAALTYDKKLIFSPNMPSANLKSMCIALRRSNKSPKHRSKRSCLDKPGNIDPLSDIPDSAYDLLVRLLDPNPHSRITAEEALTYDYLCS